MLKSCRLAKLSSARLISRCCLPTWEQILTTATEPLRVSKVTLKVLGPRTYVHNFAIEGDRSGEASAGQELVMQLVQQGPIWLLQTQNTLGIMDS